jgi:hypothetical protein
MRPRPQLESDLGTAKSSSGDNKQKEIRTRSGYEFVRIEFYFPFGISAYYALPRPKNKIWRLRFEEFEEDLVSVRLRLIPYFCICFGWLFSGTAQAHEDDI